MPFRVAATVLGRWSLHEFYISSRVRTQFAPPSLKARDYSSSQRSAKDDIQSAPDREAAKERATEQTASGSSKDSTSTSTSTTQRASQSQLSDWEHNPNLSISKFSELPEKDFGVNQHLLINQDFKEALRQILWQFRAPIRYAFAYGSGVFPQTAKVKTGTKLHPNPPEAITKVQGGNQKMIDFIFGVSYTQHWHSINLQEHRKHYSGVASLGSYAVSKIQDSFGAGVYFNPYITVNGTLIKYGVVNLDTLCKDLSEWNTLYLAGRLQKPVKILRDNPSVRLANQVNLLSAIRVALLLLPEKFTEQQLYTTIAGISYMGDPRMSVGGDDPKKVSNIVKFQLENFRQLYTPLIDNLPNVSFNDSACSNPNWIQDKSLNVKLQQNMDPVTRGHMVRRLPTAFRERLYFEYQAKWKIPRRDFNEMLEKTKDEDPDRIRRREGGEFERRIAEDTQDGGLKTEVSQVIEKTVRWPSLSQSVKSAITAGFAKSFRYASEKRQKAKTGAAKQEDGDTETTGEKKA